MSEEEPDSFDKLEEIHQEIDDTFGRKETTIGEGDEEYQLPDQSGTIYTRYRTEADIPKTQIDSFEQYRGSFGRHVALSNTLRKDNLRHLNAVDLQFIYDDIPVLRHRGTQIRIRETSEFQMCRSNQRFGGFEAELGATIIRRENVDVKQAQSLTKGNNGTAKRGGILNFLKR